MVRMLDKEYHAAVTPSFDPERIFEAQRPGVRARLTETGMTPETADRWYDAWEIEAAGRRLARDAAYWQARKEWIVEQRAACLPGW